MWGKHYYGDYDGGKKNLQKLLIFLLVIATIFAIFELF